MLTIKYRGRKANRHFVTLPLTQILGLALWGMLDKSESAHALLGYALANGLSLFVAGVVICGTLYEALDKHPTTSLEKVCKELVWHAMVGLVHLTAVLVTLGALADRPDASQEIRLWGWIPLGCFCIFLMICAAQLHGAAEALASQPKSRWELRWILVVLYVYLPLHLHFFGARWSTLVVLLTQLAFTAVLFFSYTSSSCGKEESPAESATAA